MATLPTTYVDQILLTTVLRVRVINEKLDSNWHIWPAHGIGLKFSSIFEFLRAIFAMNKNYLLKICNRVMVMQRVSLIDKPRIWGS